VTKEIETLRGKKVQAGEAFCELAVPQDFWVEVYVPEERIANVKEDQPLRLYLNNDPLKAYVLKVNEIAPAAEAHERLGNVYRVKAQFPGAEDVAMVGMKGIGKIDTADKTIWAMVSERLVKLWNRMTLHF
jgi:multidrug efflux pump subunit AcrA (membrane-fusion protein)